MHKVIFTLITICYSFILEGQVSKTLDVTAGGLKTSLTVTELATITNLTLTGTIDARDIKTMRDEMPDLSVLNLSGTSIIAYSGTEGTIPSLNDYPANSIPMYSFYINKTLLTSAILPSSVTSIGDLAFYFCTGLQNCTIPASVTSIGSMAFYNCTGLKSLNVPSSVLTIASNAFTNCTQLTSIFISSSVTDIGDGAFLNCGGAINVDQQNQNYTSKDGVLFNKQQTRLIQCPSSITGNYLVPSSVNTIGNNAFNYCSGLTSIDLPHSVNHIEYYAFGNCSGLISITFPSSVTALEGYILANCTGLTSLIVQNEKPLDLSNISGVFEGLEKTSCRLYVPYGSSVLYSAASQWNDFINIVELPEFKLSATSSLIPVNGGSVNIDLKTTLAWNAVSDKSWLTINPTSGTGTNTLTLSAEVNPSVGVRTAEVMVSAAGIPSQFISVTQEGTPKTVTITAGNLSSILTPEELSNIYSLVLKGTIDARDFKTMSYYMPGLQKVDLSGTTVVAYSGTEGPQLSYYDYPANVVPDYAFSRGLIGNETLRSIILPSGVTSVGYGAFSSCTALNSIIMPSTITSFQKASFNDCTSLTSIDLPSSLNYIGEGAFSGCSELTSITIPSSVTTIERVAFSRCTKLPSINLPASVTSVDGYIFQGEINVDDGNLVYSSIDGIMFDKLKTILIHYPSTRTGDYTIPSSVITIGSNAFIFCTGLTSVTIPFTVTNIDYSAFYNCASLKTINLPESVSFIGPFAFSGCLSLKTVIIPSSVATIWDGAFYGCTNLTELYNESPVPQDIQNKQDVFGEIDKSLCILYVPFGASQSYASASQWKDFTNIVEMAEFKLSASAFNITSAGGEVKVDLTTALPWTATSDKSWLALNPSSGTGSNSLTLTIAANPYIFTRMATITVNVPGIPSKTIFITQDMSSEKVNVSAGGLSTSLTSEELKAAKKLVLTGTIDARDFKTMRDDMPLLAELDLSGVTIAEYSGTLGTYGTNDVRYPADYIPECAFLNPYTMRGKTTLTSMVLPSSVLVIQSFAYYGCTNLTSINIPQSVMAIGHYCFFGCMSLTSADIPASVELIGNYAFVLCNGLINVVSGNQYYSSTDGVLYNKQQTTLIQCPTSKTGVFYIPFQVKSIGEYAFYNSALSIISYTSSSLTSIGNYACAYCFNLYALAIPPSVTSIGSYALYNCDQLKRIYSDSENPVDLSASEMVFEGIDINTCNLIVPFGSLALYKSANQWKDFVNIIESPGLKLSANSINFSSGSGQANVDLKTGAGWSAISDKNWLTVNPGSGYGNSILTLTALSNTSVAQRTAIVTVSATGVPSQTITVLQSGSQNSVNVSAGGLSGALTAEELNNTVKLKLNGIIDARDFKTMRDNMPLLSELDLSGVAIAAYSGTLGTYGTTYTTYPANSTPQYAFYNSDNNQGKTSLTAVILPGSVTTIGWCSFNGCTGLANINIPSSVNSLGNYAFGSCISLTSVTLPPSVTTIGFAAFWGCSGFTSFSIPSTIISIQDEAFSRCGGLFTVDEGNPNYSSSNGILFNKIKSNLIHFPISQTGNYSIPASVSTIGSSAFDYCIGLTSITIPSSVITIGNGAFRNCFGLTSVTVPASVTSIGSFAFFNCTGLRSLYARSIVPVNLNSQISVFDYVDKTQCILYVPQGSRSAYASASQWKDFANIIEMPAFNLSATNINIAASQGSTASVNVTTSVTWNAISDKSWLSVNPGSGTGNNMLVLTADANNSATPRTAIVTVSGTDVGSQTIIVIQSGILTGINEVEDFNIKIYPNPARDHIIVEPGNYSEMQDCLIEISDQLGKKVYETTINQPRYEINLSSWSGKGVYFLKFYDRNKVLIVVKKIIIQ